jgi:hypothetical protein
MARVLLVGKGAPDRGGIPSYLDSLLSSSLATEHDLRFLNVAHAGTPEGGRVTAGNVSRTVRDVRAVLRSSTSTPLWRPPSRSCAPDCWRSPAGSVAVRWWCTRTGEPSSSG